MSDFAGFPTKTITFLSELGANNDRDWFKAHRAEYEAHWVAPAKAMVAAMVPEFAEFAPAVHCDPRINGSIFRLNRDTRISKDKTPYKTQVDLWFWEGEDRGRENAGFFFRLTSAGVLLGAGMHGLQKVPLQRYRDAVNTDGARLQGILDTIEGHGFHVEGESTKRVPRGTTRSTRTPSC
ncbi:MAG: DUF2461 domain-containing protein [Proteobacteria bacterium]|nr:DUF2461 domain-containing protein [Pseudomonadota bacterium]MCP4920551.1 DUF2461 domain-containing protein [Pseudomonadota bacterium]